ncbi:MAG: TetR/AcrR family transcriptional regulator [Candidatus Gracilibacteria bacterium]|nr:TetR/AcrR family transcriptional regulator [Candidatus Gracilibacteria bacterium]
MKNKNDILYEVAVKLFGKYGPKRVSIDMIVKEAGVAKGTFYLYYKNKEILYEKIIENILHISAEHMDLKSKDFPDIQERLVHKFVGSLIFFEKNDIIRNLVSGNPDYFVGKIDLGYIQNAHIDLLKILLNDDMGSDKETLQILTGLVGFYTHIHHMRKCFPSEDQFIKFAIDFASIITKGLFTDYKTLSSKVDYIKHKAQVDAIKI